MHTPSPRACSSLAPRSNRLNTPPAGSGGVEKIRQPLRGLDLVDTLEGSQLTGQPVESRLIDLPLAERLVGLTDVRMEIANDFGNRDGITRVDLSLVLLRPPAPHGLL